MVPNGKPKRGSLRLRKHSISLSHALCKSVQRWSRASKTNSHEEEDLLLEALVNGKPVEVASGERRDMVNFVFPL